MEEKHIIGIDFGTTYSCIGAWTNGGVVIIPNGIGERTTPSVVIFDNKNKVYVGEETLNHLSKKNAVKIYEIKRLIGKKYDEIKDLINYFPFKVERQKNGVYPIIKIAFDNGETAEYSPESIASLIFKKLISNAEIFLNHKINDIIISVPADFSNNQRQAIKFAAESIPGIKILQIINEPSAAALAAGFFSLNKIKNIVLSDSIKKNNCLNSAPHPIINKGINNEFNIRESYYDLSFISNNIINNNNNEENYFLVFDLGGGTYDVSLIEINEYILETCATAGIQMLGGGDFDYKLMEYCLDIFSRNINIDKAIIKENYKSMQRLKIACEQTKKILSTKMEDKIYIEDFYKEESLNVLITRAKFENLCKEYFDKLIPPIDRVISDAKIDIEKIKEIILVGGSSKIPKIKQILSEKFKNIPINDSINPDEAVAYGATLFGEKLVRSNNELLKNFEYIDSTQHSYGIEVENGLMEIILPRGSKYPTSVTRYFHNYYDDQISFDIKVYEGENKYCKDNELLGKFTLKNLPKMKKGELICEVKFGIDINQILKINASVAVNGEKNGIIIANDDQFKDNKKIIFEDINNIEIDLNEVQKKLKLNIIDITKSFNNINNEDDKFKLILNYNKAIIEYLTFLEEKCYDIESENYLFLVEKLFKSYKNILSENYQKVLSQNEKTNVEKNINIYLKKICMKNPFRLKYLINYFENIKRNISEIFYSSSIYCMDILNEKGKKFLDLKKKNSTLIAKNIFEECLSIANSNFKDENILNLLQNELKQKYVEVKEECEKNIKIISAEFFNEIENTKKTGNLFSNNNNLDYDNLCLLSFNFSQSLKKINSINNLMKNKEALETKSICLANIVKIEFLMKKRRLSLNNLSEYADESIDIVENKMGKKYKKKKWYNEIKELKKNIKDEMDLKPATSIGEIENIRQEFNTKFNCGEEEFLKFLVEKYPFGEFNKNYNIIEEYRKNKKTLLKKLIIKYRNYDNPSNNLNHINNDLTAKKEIILEYITNILNSLKI